MTGLRTLRPVILCVLAAASAGAAADEPPPVVPYRPTFGDPADLPAPGYPELEFGYLYARGGATAAAASSTPILFKLAWSDNWGVLLGTDVSDWQRQPDGSGVRSGGDTTLTLKQRLPATDELAFGLEYELVLPTARPPIGAGSTGVALTGIVSADTGPLHIDVNLGVTRLGAPDPGTGRGQGFAAFAVSKPLSDEVTLMTDLYGNFQHGTTPNTSGMLAMSYAVTPQFVVDIGAMARLARAAPDWQVTAGFTMQLGRWF